MTSFVLFSHIATRKLTDHRWTIHSTLHDATVCKCINDKSSHVAYIVVYFTDPMTVCSLRLVLSITDD